MLLLRQEPAAMQAGHERDVCSFPFYGLHHRLYRIDCYRTRVSKIIIGHLS